MGNTAASHNASKSPLWLAEWPLALAVTTLFALLLGQQAVAALLKSPMMLVGLLGALSAVILVAALAIVRHADVLAHRLGEPGGTLLLTLAVTGLEVAMVGFTMSTGAEKPTLARDTMFAVVMLVMNGYIGLALLLGGLRHREQPYNLKSANAFLVLIIPLTVLGLILPNYTRTTAGPTLSTFQMVFLSSMSIATYSLFLYVQNRRHRGDFIAPEEAHHGAIKLAQDRAKQAAQDRAIDTARDSAKQAARDSAIDTAQDSAIDTAQDSAIDTARDRAIDAAHGHESPAATAFHALMLAAYGLPLVLLAKQLSKPMDAAVATLGAPIALSGFIVAALVLTPESIAAVQAARANQLQRSVNVLLGSVLASIGLTIPLVIAIALATGRRLLLGLEPAEMVLLTLTLATGTLTFAMPRTNVLLGGVHLMLFGAYLMLIFD